MSVRTILLNDQQLTLIGRALHARLTDPNIHFAPEDREEAELLKDCCFQTANEPEDRNMVHGFCL